ncbi:unnamed protein product, partial [Rotaria magnacalcarata]
MYTIQRILLFCSVWYCTDGSGVENTSTRKLRARDLGIPFDGTPGKYNAITDVDNVQVGFRTIIEGDSIRTGVTAIFPRGSNIPATEQRCFAN